MLIVLRLFRCMQYISECNISRFMCIKFHTPSYMHSFLNLQKHESLAANKYILLLHQRSVELKKKKK